MEYRIFEERIEKLVANVSISLVARNEKGRRRNAI